MKIDRNCFYYIYFKNQKVYSSIALPAHGVKEVKKRIFVNNSKLINLIENTKSHFKNFILEKNLI